MRNNGVGGTTFEGLYEVARQNSLRFAGVLDSIIKNLSLLGLKGSTLKSEVEIIRKKIETYGPAPERDVLTWVEDLIEKEISDEQLRNDIVQLLQTATLGGEAKSLTDLLRAVTVSLGDKERDFREGVVSVMTMHQAKGLTATAVFVAAAEDEYIPGRAVGKFVDDERRLLYVSLTHARHFLFTTYCNQRTGQQKYTGRTSGEPARHLTQFLSGRPIPAVAGDSFASRLK